MSTLFDRYSGIVLCLGLALAACETGTAGGGDPVNTSKITLGSAPIAEASARLSTAGPVVPTPFPLEAVPDIFNIRTVKDVAPGDLPLSSYRAGELVPGDEPLLHLIGAYETAEHGFQEEVTGHPIVHVGPTLRPVVLAFGSYEASEWNVDLAEGANVVSIVLLGYKAQTVVGAGDIPVTNLSDAPGSTCGYHWPFSTGGSNTQALVAQAEAASGLPLTAFDGDYLIDELWIEHVPGTCTPKCNGRACGPDGCGGTCGVCADEAATCNEAGQCLVASALPACEGLPSDAHVCLAYSDTGPVAIGLESGNLCAFGAQVRPAISEMPSLVNLAWIGDSVYTCGAKYGYEGMLRFSIPDGTVELGPHDPCLAVTAWNGGLLMFPGTFPQPTSPAVFYPTFDDVKAGAGTEMGEFTVKSNVAAEGDTFYTARHSTGEVLTYPLSGGGESGSLALEGYDNWILGLSVTSDGLLVVNGTWPDGRVLVFDATTGKLLWSLDDQALGRMSGMACRTN